MNGAGKLRGRSLSNVKTGPDLLPSLFHSNLFSTVQVCSRCRHKRNVSASWSYSTQPTVTSFPVVGRSSFRNSCLPISPVYPWLQRLAHVRQLRVESHWYRQLKQCSASSSKCTPEIVHGSILVVKSCS